jgi:5-methylcytosine-specific restriction endonuclease McrA
MAEPITQAPNSSTRVLDRATLVLNRSWVPIHVTTVRRAICLLFRDAAAVVSPSTMQTYSFAEWLDDGHTHFDAWVSASRHRIAAPDVIQLTAYNRVPAHRAPFTRRNLFARDGHTCQYCSTRFRTDELTIDHVVPRSRGGPTSWINCVVSCVSCNARKGDRTPLEARMRLMREPKCPRWSPYLGLSRRQHLPTWQAFTGRVTASS